MSIFTGLRRYFRVQMCKPFWICTQMSGLYICRYGWATSPKWLSDRYSVWLVLNWYYKCPLVFLVFKKKCLFSAGETVAFHRLSCPDGKNRLSLNFGGLVNWMVLLKVLKCKQTFFFCCWVQCYSVWKPSEYVLFPCLFECFVSVLFSPHPCTGTFWTVQGVCTFMFVLLLYFFHVLNWCHIFWFKSRF